MNSDQQFWWNWGVNLAVAVGTLGAVVVALFGEYLRPKPRLKLKLLRKEGEKTLLTRIESGEYADDVGYYHLRISNERRWCPAENTQVYLTRLEEP